MSPVVRLIAIVILWMLTLAFDVFMTWVIGFTYAWNGGFPLGTDVIGFWIFVLVPVVLTGCAVHLTRVFFRDKRQQS